ncbi:acyl-CoA dehydrogenase [Xanthobacter sp. KR7-65]|uniref:acyl-CoA dehydrogenase family protein n=1 Tax=Xanthobacter sp. KR7-65 TaxID=3156612 RepID=UPI0032B459F0
MMQPTADQTLMRDNAIRLLGDGAARTRAATAEWPAIDRSIWLEVCRAGWPALLLSEERGGWGASAIDMIAVLEGTFSTLAPEPLGPALSITPLLARCGTKAADELLTRLLRGEALALMAGADPFPISPGLDYVAFEANWADTIICASGAGSDFRLWAIPSEGLDVHSPVRRTIDGGAQRVFPGSDAGWQEIGRGVDVEMAYEHAVNLQRLGAAAGLMGIAQRALDMTIDYLKVRQQFGQPIGAFQALQHRAASLHVACVAGRALVYEAGLSMGSARERVACAMAKARSSTTARDVLKECVQLHGAIGFSDEYDLAVCFRKVMTLASAYGTAEACAAIIAREIGGAGRD